VSKTLLKKLYLSQGLSTYQIAQKIGISQWSVIYLMKKYNINRRQPSETRKIQFLKSPLSYSIRHNLSSKEKLLKYTGLMLYWGEGAKSGKGCVDFANSDPNMARVFLRMLRKIYRIKEEKVRILLYCYANQDVDKLIKYWAKMLRVSESLFIKPYIRADFDISKSSKMPKGLIHIRYNDMRLLLQIKADIDIIYRYLLTS
jgi:hypothetical protein